MTKKEVLRFWLYFKLYLISLVVVFIIVTIFCSWICIFPATAGIVVIILWYRHAKKALKQKGLVN